MQRDAGGRTGDLGTSILGSRIPLLLSRGSHYPEFGVNILESY